MTDSREVYAWGSSQHGALGLGSLDFSKKRGLSQTTPAVIPSLIVILSLASQLTSQGKNVIEVAAGGGHSIALCANGQVFSWGLAENGQTGHGDHTVRHNPTLTQLENVVQVAAGRSHSAALDDKGNLFMFGNGRNGQLGLGISEPEALKPTKMTSVPQHFVRVSCGSNSTLAITGQGRLLFMCAGISATSAKIPLPWFADIPPGATVQDAAVGDGNFGSLLSGGL